MPVIHSTSYSFPVSSKILSQHPILDLGSVLSLRATSVSEDGRIIV